MIVITMIRICVAVLVILSIEGLGRAQAPAPLSFEVASIRPAGQTPPHTPIAAGGEITGGPGTGDPTRMTFTWTQVRVLLMRAFALPIDQISGSDWVMGQDARFDIAAVVPAAATKEQADKMLLNLLKERFHLAYHSEKKDFDLYTLVVAKGGPKLKDAAAADGPLPDPPQPGSRAVAAPLDRDGFPQLPAGRPGFQGRGANGVPRATYRMATPQMLLNSLQFQLRPSRTADKTGLTGQYDFTLEYSTVGLPGPMGRPLSASSGEADQPDSAPDLFTALEKQLGLKLEKSKTQLDVMVVDRMDKVPTEN